MATMEEFKDDGDEGGEGEGPQRRAAPGAAAVTAVVVRWSALCVGAGAFENVRVVVASPSFTLLTLPRCVCVLVPGCVTAAC